MRSFLKGIIASLAIAGGAVAVYNYGLTDEQRTEVNEKLGVVKVEAEKAVEQVQEVVRRMRSDKDSAVADNQAWVDQQWSDLGF